MPTWIITSCRVHSKNRNFSWCRLVNIIARWLDYDDFISKPLWRSNQLYLSVDWRAEYLYFMRLFNVLHYCVQIIYFLSRSWTSIPTPPHPGEPSTESWYRYISSFPCMPYQVRLGIGVRYEIYQMMIYINTRKLPWINILIVVVRGLLRRILSLSIAQRYPKPVFLLHANALFVKICSEMATLFKTNKLLRLLYG